MERVNDRGLNLYLLDMVNYNADISIKLELVAHKLFSSIEFLNDAYHEKVLILDKRIKKLEEQISKKE